MGNEVLNLSKPVQARAEIVSALAIGTIALLVLGLQPILLGAMVEARSATLGFWSYFKVGAPLTLLTILFGVWWL